MPTSSVLSVPSSPITFHDADNWESLARALVARLLAERARFARFELFIEASSVSFGAPGSRERGTVRHLRLIDLYERMLAQALRNALTATALAARETEDPARREAP